MEEKKIKLTISTPKGTFFSDFVDILTVKLPNGYKGVQKNILPFVSNVLISTMYINSKNSKNYKVLAISGGIIYAERDYVDIFTDDIIYKAKISEVQLKLEAQQKEEQLKNKENLSSHEKQNLELELKKVLNKLNTFYEK